MQAIAQILRTANICPEAELPQFSINAKAARYRFSRSNETGAMEAFACTTSDMGTSGRCLTAQKVVSKSSLTASQLHDLGHAASSHIAGWYLKK
jgi:hypothetical protein